jgi:hypothetical protein
MCDTGLNLWKLSAIFLFLFYFIFLVFKMVKKKFIDKKNARHFHLVHRSQRDPLIVDAEASDRVFKEITKVNSITTSKNYLLVNGLTIGKNY